MPPRNAILDAFLRFVIAALLCGGANVVRSLPILRDPSFAPHAALILKGAFISGVVSLLPLGPASLVEGFGSRFREGWIRDLIVGVVALVLACATVPLMGPARMYAQLIASGQTGLGAMQSFEGVQFMAMPKSWGVVAFIAELVLPFAVFAFVRSRRLSAAWQVAAIAASSLRGFARLVADRAAPSSIRESADDLVMLALALPLAAVLARKLEGRLVDWITREERPPVHAIQGATVRRSRFALVALVVAGAAFLVHVHRRHADQKAAPQAVRTNVDIALAEEWKIWRTGAYTSSQVADLISRSLAVSHLVRARIGTDDPLCVAIDTRGNLGRGLSTSVTAAVGLDDGPLMPCRLPIWGVAKSFTRLEPGFHEISVVSSITAFQNKAALWSRTQTSRHVVKVVEGSVRGEIALVKPRDFELDDALSISQRPFDENVWVSLRDPPWPAYLRFSVFERGRLVGEFSNWWRRPSFEHGSGYHPNQWGLSPGRHRLTFRVRPDPDLALSLSASDDEILDAAIEREIDIDVP